MKTALVTLVALAAVAAAVASPAGWSGFPRKRSLAKRDSQANINDYLDKILTNAVKFIESNNLEPLKLTDQYLYNFTFKDLVGINWKTRLGLYSGEAQNLTTLHRASDAQISYTSDARQIDVTATVQFDRLVVIYHYAAQTLNLGPAGTFTATLKNLTASVDISVNLRSFNATLKSFKLKTAKSIKTKVTGLSLLGIGDKVVSLFINIFLKFLTGPIFRVIENVITGVIASAVSSTDAGNLTINIS